MMSAPIRSLFSPALLLVLSAMLQSGIAEADGADNSVVLLVDPSRPDAGTDLSRVVRAQISDLDVSLLEVVVETVPATIEEYRALDIPKHEIPDMVAIIWAQWSDEGEITLFICEPEGKRFLVRRLAPETRGAGHEAIALIVRSAVEVLLVGGKIGVAPPPEEPAQPAAEAAPEIEKPKPASAPGAPIPSIFGVRLGYAFQPRSNDVFLHGFSTGLSAVPTGWFEAVAGYTFFTPARPHSDDAEIEVRRRPIHFGVALGFSRNRWRIQAPVMATVDFTNQRTRRISDETAYSDPPNEDVIWSLVAGLEVRAVVTGHLEIFAGVAMESVFNPVRYFFTSHTENRAVEDPWRVQPRLTIGMRIGVFGKMHPNKTPRSHSTTR